MSDALLAFIATVVSSSPNFFFFNHSKVLHVYNFLALYKYLQTSLKLCPIRIFLYKKVDNMLMPRRSLHWHYNNLTIKKKKKENQQKFDTVSASAPSKSL